MKRYKFIGSEQDLIDNGFTYRKHYDTYILPLFQPDRELNIELYSGGTNIDRYPQDFYIQINHNTGSISIFTRALKDYPHGEREHQYDISHKLIEAIVVLINKGLVEVVE